MAKTIKMTFYSPKELWQRFWTWAFWPRRKVCAEWIDSMQVLLEERIVSDLLIGKYYNGNVLSEATVNSLDIDIKEIIGKTSKEMKKVIRQPLYDVEL